jgi:phytoene dehydrogenase-like protein
MGETAGMTGGRRGGSGAVDAVVVGSGPNGLAAAITLAEAGLSVTVVEGAATAGGGCRTETSPGGFRHDVCSTVHPLVLASPFFRRPAFEGLRERVRHPEVPFAHPLDGGRAGVVHRSVGQTAESLGVDAARYRRLLGPLARNAEGIAGEVLGPLRSIPRHPAALARFGLPGLLPMAVVARSMRTEEGRAILGGVGAHSMNRLTAPLTGAFGLLLLLIAHAYGWPVLEGGSSAITDALVTELAHCGGTVSTGQWVSSLDELPPATAVLLDTAPTGLVELAGDALPVNYARALSRFRYGPGVCKLDWELSGPVPWTAEAARGAGTVHVGGTIAEVAASEAAANAGRHTDRPFCLVVQAGVADPSRAPAGRQALWGYCHVPSGSDRDMTGPIESQIERFAPGFRDLVLARRSTTAVDEERLNPNYVGGDITAGAATLRQTIFRPTAQWNPYRTPLEGVYLCSASTPPGGGVHGVCGVYAARSVLHDHFGGPPPFRRTMTGEPARARRPA